MKEDKKLLRMFIQAMREDYGDEFWVPAIDRWFCNIFKISPLFVIFENKKDREC